MDAGIRRHRLQPHRMTAHLRTLRDEATQVTAKVTADEIEEQQ